MENAATNSQRPKPKVNFGKRKSNSNNYGGRSVKQHITEARITASMQRLNLDFQRPHSDSQNDRADDDGFFEETTDDSDEILDSDNMFDCNHDDEADEGMSEEMTRFCLAPEVKKFIEKKDNILPKAILDSIAPKPCMALVPYVPPIQLHLPDSKKTSVKNSVSPKPVVESQKSPAIEEMCIEEWDSCDDSDTFMLE